MLIFTPLDVECRGYGRSMTALDCLKNQLSPLCLSGWPCEDCEMAVAMKGQKFYCNNLGVTLSPELCDAARLEAQRRSLVWPEGLGWLKICLECSIEATERQSPPPPSSPLFKGEEKEAKVGNEVHGPVRDELCFSGPSGRPSLKPAKTGRKSKTEVYDPRTMSRAVARDLGLI